MDAKLYKNIILAYIESNQNLLDFIIEMNFEAILVSLLYFIDGYCAKFLSLEHSFQLNLWFFQSLPFILIFYRLCYS